MFVGPVILCRSDCIFIGPVDELDCCALALDGNDSGTRHSRGHEDPSIKAKKSSKPCDRASILAVGRRHDCQWTEPGKVLAQLGERPPVGGLAPRSLAKGAVRRPPCPESLESRQTESHGLVLHEQLRYPQAASQFGRVDESRWRVVGHSLVNSKGSLPGELYV